MNPQGDVLSSVRAITTERLMQISLSEQLVRACLDGDSEAQRKLYECYKAKVYSLAIYLTGSVEMSEDLTQEIFLKIFRDLDSFRFDCDFGTWLYRLSVNTCLNALRRRRSRHETCIEEIIGTTAEMDKNKTQEQQQDDRLIQKSIQKAILSLKPRLRTVVVLRYIENLSYKEIAEVLSCSAGTVAARLNRAHRLLERKLHIRQ